MKITRYQTKTELGKNHDETEARNYYRLSYAA